MTEPRPLNERGHMRGRPSSWIVVGVIIAATITGGFALIFHILPLLYAMAGVFVLGVIGGRVVGIMDDTVGWVAPLAKRYQQPGGSAILTPGPREENAQPGTEQLNRYMEDPGQRERLATAAHPEAVTEPGLSPEQAQERLDRIKAGAREKAPGGEG